MYDQGHCKLCGIDVHNSPLNTHWIGRSTQCVAEVFFILSGRIVPYSTLRYDNELMYSIIWKVNFRSLKLTGPLKSETPNKLLLILVSRRIRSGVVIFLSSLEDVHTICSNGLSVNVKFRSLHFSIYLIIVFSLTMMSLVLSVNSMDISRK